MFAPRTVVTARTGTRVAARRVGGARVCQRFQSSMSTPPPSSFSSNLLAGLTGGGAVLLGGYAWYHFSGTKQTVQTANQVKQYVQDTKDSIVQKAPKNPNEVLGFLRNVAKSYAGVIPGASTYVDQTFDHIDQLRDTHGEEFEKILQATYDDVTNVLKEVKDKGLQGMDAATAGKLMSIISKRVAELNELGKKVGGDVFGKLEQNYPQVASTLGGSYQELKAFAERSGPETKKLVSDTVKQVQDILSNSKNTPETVNRVRELIEQKGQQLKETVWNNVAKEAEKNPELKDLLNQNKAAFVAAGSSFGSLSDVLDRVRQVLKDGADPQKVNELKEFVQSRAKEAQTKGWEGLQSWIKSMPGGEEALKNLSEVDIQSLIALTKDKSEDAKHLAEETYQDILKVLKDKAGKAKKIADEGKQEVKQNKSS
ncbi:uncharacterized protein PHACADRAFT_258266 [Phanerochaete carnosa HHB-10118-sp]|uniref:Uncharacterized protein n=1 Tax=Phanerochaete carnosa (strain HHB-10118-sp) TaxID=650164 RepID=K5VSG7_PHACS|nr:uncharacterized protein PHACADRAFT_258266 [Phanerochaete carnosa HHB-10118-sp]EKM54428.1 hypothetical protein PHACADRAFT_258266 [Phanerochaete carnosa HHB-10118-sp]